MIADSWERELESQCPPQRQHAALFWAFLSASHTDKAGFSAWPSLQSRPSAPCSHCYCCRPTAGRPSPSRQRAMMGTTIRTIKMHMTMMTTTTTNSTPPARARPLRLPAPYPALPLSSASTPSPPAAIMARAPPTWASPATPPTCRPCAPSPSPSTTARPTTASHSSCPLPPTGTAAS